MQDLVKGAQTDPEFQSRLRVMDIDQADLQQLFEMRLGGEEAPKRGRNTTESTRFWKVCSPPNWRVEKGQPFGPGGPFQGSCALHEG